MWRTRRQYASTLLNNAINSYQPTMGSGKLGWKKHQNSGTDNSLLTEISVDYYRLFCDGSGRGASWTQLGT